MMNKAKRKPIQRSKRDWLILVLLVSWELIIGAVLSWLDLILNVVLAGCLLSAGMTFIFNPFSFIPIDTPNIYQSLFVVYLIGISFIFCGLYSAIKFFSSDFWEFKTMGKASEKAEMAFYGNNRLARHLGIETDYGDVIPPGIECDEIDFSRLDDNEDCNRGELVHLASKQSLIVTK